MRGFLRGSRHRFPGGRSAAALAASALLLAAAFAPVSRAAAPYPTLGTAVVDGDAGEWSAADYFADMTDNGDPGNETRATISLRYDCDTGTLYALVMATGDGQLIQDRPDQAYLRIDGKTVVRGENGDDGTPPDFAWIGGDGLLAEGFEASAVVAPGSYKLRAHVLLDFDDSDGYLTLDSVPREAPLTLDCPESAPTATPTGSVSPTAAPTATPTGSVSPTAAPTPDGGVGGATGTPGTTLPPTDTMPSSPGADPSSGGGGSRLVLLLLAAIVATLALLTPPPAGNRSRRG